MNVLFDTNVILDVLLARSPFKADATTLMKKVETNDIRGLLCATTITTIHYFVARQYNQQDALKGITSLLKMFDIAPVNKSILDQATQSKIADFEDAVLHESALLTGADAIVTRNSKDFKHASLVIYQPHELVALLSQTNDKN